MNTKKRLEALEEARTGGDLLPVEVWSQDQADPRMFTLEGTEERRTQEEMNARRAQIVSVTVSTIFPENKINSHP